jgi:phage RecT family recombinase
MDHFRDLCKERVREIAALFPNEGVAAASRLLAIAANGYRGLLSNTRDGDEPVHPYTVLQCTVAAAQLGLEFLGDQAYLVPYNGSASLIVGPGGLILLGARSGFVRSTTARCVFDADEFDYQLGSDEYVHHRKAPTGRRMPKEDVQKHITHAYCVLQMATPAGEAPARTCEVLTAEDIAFYRSFSKARKGPWFDNFEGMGRKTVIKRAYALAPKSPLLEIALRETDHGTLPMQRDRLGVVDIDGDVQTERRVSVAVPPASLVSQVNSAIRSQGNPAEPPTAPERKAPTEARLGRIAVSQDVDLLIVQAIARDIDAGDARDITEALARDGHAVAVEQVAAVIAALRAP